MTNRLKLAALTALSLLGACAPAQQGTMHTPLQQSSVLSPVEVPGAGTWYVSSRYNPDLFGVQKASRDSAANTNWNGSDGSVFTAPVSWFSTGEVRVPEGWAASVASASMRRELRRQDNTYIYYSDSINVVYAVTVPASAKPGTYSLSITVRGDGVHAKGEPRAIPMIVTVAGAGPSTRN